MRIRRGGLSSFQSGNIAQRFAGSGAQGSAPEDFPDVRQVEQARRAAGVALPQFGPSQSAPVDGVVRTVPLRVRYIPWWVESPTAFTPVLLVPANPKRVHFVIANYFTTNAFGVGLDKVYFSFGQPPIVPTISVRNGLPIPPDTTLPWPSAIVPTDEIWAWHNDAGSHFMLAYEAIESGEGNP